ncbi:MAG: hypothetical protein RMJ05_08885 [Thermomicrobium sp.]|nr:hypothetical protein [Thermomicrobium sp.]MDW8006823.1 hypothetical protein [Thermomicrobium sp.]
MGAVHWTGQPFIDAGLAALAAAARLQRLDQLTVAHLDTACQALERVMLSDEALGVDLERSFARGPLSQVFPNSELVNPSNWKNGAEGVRAKYRQALQEDLQRAKKSLLLDGTRRCIGCGAYRAAETFMTLRRDRFPLLSGTVNFYPSLAYGVDLCGLCVLALRFLPLSLLRAGDRGRIWFLHCQELKVAGVIAQEYGWRHISAAIAAGEPVDFYGEWRTAGNTGAVARLLFRLLDQFGAQLRSVYERRIPAIAYLFSNDLRSGYIEVLPIPTDVLEFIASLYQESPSAFKQFEHELLDFPPGLDRRAATAREGFIRSVSRQFLRAESIIGMCLAMDGEQSPRLLGGWLGHRLYLLEVLRMPAGTLAVLERLGIDLAQHEDAKKWVGRLERARPNELRAILLDLVRARLLSARELAAIVPPNEPSAAGVARDILLAVAYEWQRSANEGRLFPRLADSVESLPKPETVIEELAVLARRLSEGLRNRSAWIADLSTARSLAQLRGAYLRAVRQGVLTARDFLFLVPFTEPWKAWALRDYLLAFLFENVGAELPAELEILEGEEVVTTEG